MNPFNEERKRGCILVVDTDVPLRLMAKTTLDQAGYQVVEEEDGAIALDVFTTCSPDAVLLGSMPPGINGFLLCAAIRALPNGKDLPIIMTGLDDPESIVAAYRAGATDFITKPILWQTLAYRVHYLFRASQAFRELRKSEERLSQAQRLAHMGSWEWDPTEDRLQVSDTCRLILDLPRTGVPLNLAALLALAHPEDRNQLTRTFETAASRLEPICTDFRIITNDQAERHVHVEAEVRHEILNQGIRITGTLQDISDRKKSEEQIRFLAYYDNLTGLANRVLFKEHLTRALALARRHNGKLAVLFIDLDRFKGINDSLGHSTGDLLLQGIAERLQNCIRQSDTICRQNPNIGEWCIARLGGDEFMILLDNVTTPDSSAIVAQRVIESLTTPFQLGTYEVYVTCSIGISLFPDDALEPEELIRNADIAMYAAKELGRNTFQFFQTKMNTATLQRLMMETLLRGAIERSEFVLHFQPQVDSSTGRLVSMEALVRWQRPEMGLVSPATFIPIAEESGLIVDIDEWVLNNVCRQLQQWQKEGISPVRVAVNLSGRHFRKNTLVSSVSRALAETGVSPNLLELELTEGVLMQQRAETVATLSTLRKMGVNISIDDFGTGYSSLNYLKNFPLTTLKIDRCFVKEIGKCIEVSAIIKAIIALAKGLRLEIIAEGVETEEQLAFLNDNGCAIIQGFLYSRPLTLADASAILSKGLILGPIHHDITP